MPNSERRLPSRHCVEALESRLLLSTTWTVTTTADDGTSGTLRYAITHSAAGDTIQFDSAAFASGSTHTITLNSGQLEIAHNLTIQGPGSAVLSVSGNNTSRVFQIDSGVTATISGLTITHGNAGSANGGAISDQGTLNLSNSVLHNNAASHSGGLYILQGNANVTNCTFSNNTSTTLDGAVGCDTGTAATFIGCTFNNNTAVNGGGAIVGYDNSLTLINDTFTANSATGGPGGAIDNLAGTCTITNCTIAANTSTSAGAGVYAGTSVLINNSIVAQNTANGSPSDLAGPALSSSSAYNLIGDGSGGLGTASHNLLGSTASLLNPKLGSLSNNGGPTPTMLPLTGSPVIDAGSNSLVPSAITIDQRGLPRMVNGGVDIGSVEVQSGIPNEPDATFGTNGQTVTAFSGSASDFGYAAIIQPDGKTVAVGTSSGVPNSAVAAARYNSDGSLDSTFGSGGRVLLSFAAHDHAFGAALQPDGKLVLVGSISGNTASTAFEVIRINPNGSPDTTFNGTGEEQIYVGNGYDVANAVIIQPDGKIVLGGQVMDSSGVQDWAMLRLNPSGGLDSAFGSGGEVVTPITKTTSSLDKIEGLALDLSGDILAVGRIGISNSGHLALARFAPGGNLDPTFGVNGLSIITIGTIDEAAAVAVQSDGRIVVGGTTWSGGTRVLAARFQSNGSLDTTFGTNGIAFAPASYPVDVCTGVGVMSDGRIVLGASGGSGASGSPYYPFVARFTSSGAADPTYGSTGEATGAAMTLARGMSLHLNGTVTEVGQLTTSTGTGSDFDLAQFTPSGSVDAGFGNNGVVTTDFLQPAIARATAMALQPDGKAVVAGYADVRQAPFTSDVAVVRYNTDGSPDTSFGTNGIVLTTIGYDDEAQEVTLLANGDILVAGSTVNPSTQGGDVFVARYLPSGTLDSSFGSSGIGLIKAFEGSGTSNTLAGLTVQSDGSMIVAITLAGGGGFALAKLNPSGQLDTSYGGGGTTTPNISLAKISAISLDLSGRVVVAGTVGNSAPQQFLVARFDTTGKLDTTFGSGSGYVESAIAYYCGANSLALQPDGKIVVGGSASNDFAVARYNPDGSLDGTFGTGGVVTTDFGAVEWINSIRLLPDGSLLALGTSASDPGSPGSVAVAHYTAAGALDLSYAVDGKALVNFGDARVAGNAMAVRGDGRIVVAGQDYPQFMVGQIGGFVQDVFTGTRGNDTITLSQNRDHLRINWSTAGQNGTLPIGDLAGLTIIGNGGADTLTLDYTNGDPLPAAVHLNGSFTIAGLQTLAGTTLEIGRSTVYLSYAGSADPLAAIQADLRNGYNAGGWNGAATPTTGAITTAAGSSAFGIGCADSADGTGVDTVANTIELKYTLLGDANLDGTVNLADFVALTRNFGKTAGWDGGDFNYDGVVSLPDLLMLTRNFGKTAPALAGIASAYASAPVQQNSAAGLLDNGQNDVNTKLAARRRR